MRGLIRLSDIPETFFVTNPRSFEAILVSHRLVVQPPSGYKLGFAHVHFASLHLNLEDIFEEVIIESP
jgi:hypothetical protein